MAFDFGSFLGGAGSGAASGASIGGPWGAAIGGLLGGFGSAFGGGETPTYQPTPLQQNLIDYGTQQVTADESTRRRIKNAAKMYSRSGGPGAAESFLESYMNTFSNPKFISKALTRSYKKDVDYGSPAFWNTADQLYRSQGIGFTGDQYGSFVEAAKARGIRSPQAFGDMLKQQMITEGKVATPQQELFGAMFGGLPRDASGKVLDLYPKLNMRTELARPITTNTITVS